MMRAAPTSLDPADPSLEASWSGRNLSRAIFETLATLDDHGRLQPALATAWQAEPGNQRWVFSLRNQVHFHDGSPLTAEAVASSLRAANPEWKVFSSGIQVVIEPNQPDAKLPLTLTLPRNAIAKRTGKLVGTGPFAIEEWIPGSKLTLIARDDNWRGRPFVDRVVIEMGKNLREQQIALDLGKADITEVAPEQARHNNGGGIQVISSPPLELIALVFARDPHDSQEARLREALALSLDREAMNRVLLQGSGEVAACILPNWITGYGFLFSPDKDLNQARQDRDQTKQAKAWTLTYPAEDPLARLLAERIALNATDADISLRLSPSADSAIRLMRIPISSLDGGIALATISAALQVPLPNVNVNSVEDLYNAEKALLNSQRIIPLLHVRISYAIAPAVNHWTEGHDGSWRLGDVWLGAEKP
jgi:ABC-type transport system substrate-binding protein